MKCRCEIGLFICDNLPTVFIVYLLPIHTQNTYWYSIDTIVTDSFISTSTQRTLDREKVLNLCKKMVFTQVVFFFIHRSIFFSKKKKYGNFCAINRWDNDRPSIRASEKVGLLTIRWLILFVRVCLNIFAGKYFLKVYWTVHIKTRRFKMHAQICPPVAHIQSYAQCFRTYLIEFIFVFELNQMKFQVDPTVYRVFFFVWFCLHMSFTCA